MDQNSTARPEEVADLNHKMIPEGWTTPPTLANLKTDLTGASSNHSAQTGLIRNWLDNLEVKGAAKVNTPTGSSKIVPKLIRKQAEWRYPALSEPFLSTENMFKIDPTTWEDVECARQNSLLLNNQMNTKVKKVKFIDRLVRDAVNKGTAIVRVGWAFEEAITEVEVPLVRFHADPSLAPLHQQLAGMKDEDPTRYQFDVPEELREAHERTVQTGVPMRPEVLEWQTHEVTKTTKNCPTLEVVDYRNVIIDPSCEGDMDLCSFIIYKFETSKSALKKEGRYTNLDNIQIANSSALGEADDATTGDGGGFQHQDDARKKFYAYEYWGFWDFNDSGIAQPFVTTWVGDTVIRMEENPFPDKKLPFVVIPFLPVDGSVYGEPDGELLEDNQKVTGAVTRGMIDVMAKAANGQQGVRKGTLDAANRYKFMHGQDYEYNGNVNPDVAFYMHTFPEIPVSAQYMLQQQAVEAESMSGVKAFSNKGLDGNALGDSVGNGKSVLDAATKRETGILRRLADGMEQVGRKMIAMNSEFLDEEEVVRVTNNEFVKIRRDDLAGNYDLKLKISTAEEDNAKAQELAFMNQTIGPKAEWGVTKIILRDIARLRKMPELAHELENYEPKPDPAAEQMQQAELQGKALENALLEAKIEAEYAGAGLDNAKAQEAIAKARLAGAQAEQADLDFVEQESGVKQERDLEKGGEQARSNIGLKAMDHAMHREERQYDLINRYLDKKEKEENKSEK